MHTHPPWVDTPLVRHIPRADTLNPHPWDGHCSGRYASYWNAFLFWILNCPTTYRDCNEIPSWINWERSISTKREVRFMPGIPCTFSEGGLQNASPRGCCVQDSPNIRCWCCSLNIRRSCLMNCRRRSRLIRRSCRITCKRRSCLIRTLCRITYKRRSCLIRTFCRIIYKRRSCLIRTSCRIDSFWCCPVDWWNISWCYQWIVIYSICKIISQQITKKSNKYS